MARLFLYFMIYSFIGWSYETALYSVRNRCFVDSGMMYGCYCPIYGIGSMINILIFGNVENAALIFFGAMAACCVLEYFASWCIERISGARWWDYSDWPFNINGRICLFGAIVFGFMSVVVVRAIHPTIVRLVDLFPSDYTTVVAAAVFAVFCGDVIATAYRCRKMPRSEEVNVVLKLPFDFMPEIPDIGKGVRGLTSAVADRGNTFLEMVREKLEELLRNL